MKHREKLSITWADLALAVWFGIIVGRWSVNNGWGAAAISAVLLVIGWVVLMFVIGGVSLVIRRLWNR